MIHVIFKGKLWVNLKNSWKEPSNIYTTWKVSHTRVLLVLTHHTTWFISLGENGLLQFFQEFSSIIMSLFLALLVIIKLLYLFFFWNLNIQSFTLFIWMGQFSIWSENVQRSPKITYIDVFSFSSKYPRTFETLSRGWHKNCSQYVVKKVLDFAEKW